MQNVKNLSPLKIYVKQKIYKTSRPKTVKMVWSRAKCKSANRLKKKKKKQGHQAGAGLGSPGGRSTGGSTVSIKQRTQTRLLQTLTGSLWTFHHSISRFLINI